MRTINLTNRKKQIQNLFQYEEKKKHQGQETNNNLSQKKVMRQNIYEILRMVQRTGET